TGQTPMVTWEPYDQSIAQIASGAYDSYLHQSAQIAKSWGRPLMIRFAHEMNGTWYPWAGPNSTPDAFVAAWRHVVSLFRADGVTNVQWVWSPNVQEGSKYPISPYFPGEEWIDYVALDGYNWGTVDGERWQSMQEVFAPSYALVTQLSAKPVIITETSSSETGGDKSAWIRKGFMTEIPQSFPRVSAVVWFNKAQEDDWRIDSSQASLDAYRAVVDCSLYGGSGSCESGTTTTGTGGKKRKKVAVRSLRVTEHVAPEVTGAVSYGLTDSAEVKIEIIPRKHPGRRFKVTRHSHRGHNRVPLRRLIRKRNLRAGSYRVVIAARSDEGQRTRRHKDGFRVLG
ncbi:MAG TPA: glycosyl hydrolase, partial [Solirubrobacterales bacterium]|nr:glycosyl hydrolase [Solirubrobacterales bacterium]